MKTANNISELIGNTPILKLNNYAKKHSLCSSIYAKLEYLNPQGSTKDRAAYYMLSDAIESGRLKEGGTIIESTSGNTGIGLAFLAASMGYKLILTMPENMSSERIALLKAYGTEIVLTPADKGMSGAADEAERIKKETENSVIIGQFSNKSNSKAHYLTTGPEIYADMDGKIDYLVASVGSGGTITGIGEYLKSKDKNIKIVAVEPSASPLLSKGYSGRHKIQGIGANFIPEILNMDIIDEIIAVSDEDAIAAMKELTMCEGVFCGISSGAALCAARSIAEREKNKNIVAVLPDTGTRYLSSL